MKKLLLIVSFLALLAPVVSFASPISEDDNFFLPAGETYQGNLYAFGGVANILGDVNGDLIIAGGTVNVSGNISKDILVIGGTVNINGNVGDDLRFFGGNVTIGGNIGGDLIGLGGQLMVLSKTSVAKKVKVLGGNISFDGATKENTQIWGGGLVFSGQAQKNLEVVSDAVSISGGAFIGGDFKYSSKSEAKISSSAKIIGKTEFKKTDVSKNGSKKANFLGVFGFWWFAKFLMLSVASLLVFFFWKEGLSISKNTPINFWKEVLRGLILLVVVPIVSIILAITVIGLPLTGVMIIFYSLMLLLASIFSGIVVGEFISKHIFKHEGEMKWYVVIIGVLIYQLLKLFPFIGWIVVFLIYLSAFGSVSNGIYKRIFGKN